MARTRQRRSVGGRKAAQRRRWWLWIAAPVVGVAAVVGIYAARRGDEARLSDAPRTDPGVVHVHGLGINPANGDVYAATHMGVFHINNGRATRIADRYQDTMGFTVVGPDHFLASGHPDLREKLPPLLGLLESRDAGRTWQKKSLLGEADFHALRYAHETIYGYDSTGSRFMVSRNGVDWETRSKPVLGDFAVSPADRDEIIATTPRGLARSTDGGRTWKELEGAARPVFVAWDLTRRLWVLDDEGRLHVTTDAGSTWAQRGRAVGRPEALLVTDDKVYTATSDAILVSADQGRTWNVVYKEGGSH